VRVIAILGSPRKEGNGTNLVREIEKRMNASDRVEFEYLHLVDADLKMCRGCFKCISHSEDRCPLQDARKEIEAKIDAADGIILVSPGYVQNVSGLMKNFMDRMAYTNHRPRFFGKKMMIVANGGAGLDKTLGALRIAIAGPEIVSEVAWAQLPWPTDPKYDTKKQKRLVKAVNRFHAALVAKDKKPSFGSYMRFRFFKDISPVTARWLPADERYYATKEEYFCPAKIGLGKKLGAAVVLGIVKRTMKSMAPYVEDEVHE
jgi:NAD(P)H-dependent FMN reductase